MTYAELGITFDKSLLQFLGQCFEFFGVFFAGCVGCYFLPRSDALAI